MKKAMMALILVVFSVHAKASGYPILNQTMTTEGFVQPKGLQLTAFEKADVKEIMASTKQLLKAFVKASDVKYTYNRSISGPQSQPYLKALQVASRMLSTDGAVIGQTCSLSSIEITRERFVRSYELECGFGVNFRVQLDVVNVEIDFGYAGGDGSGSEHLDFKGTVEWQAVGGKYQYVFAPKSLNFDYNGGS